MEKSHYELARFEIGESNTAKVPSRKLENVGRICLNGLVSADCELEQKTRFIDIALVMGERKFKRERQIDRETDRQRGIQRESRTKTESEKSRQRGKESQRQTDRQTDRLTDRQTYREIETHGESHRQRRLREIKTEMKKITKTDTTSGRERIQHT